MYVDRDPTEIEELNHAELIMILDALIKTRQSSESTKYKAPNIQSNITVEQRKVLERLFDSMSSVGGRNSDSFIAKIIRE